MLLYIDPSSVQKARYVNQIGTIIDRRYYYLLETGDGTDAIIVCRGGHTIQSLVSRIVDANVGNDVAQPGFASEEQIGQTRTKVTIYRPVISLAEAPHSLSSLLK